MKKISYIIFCCIAFITIIYSCKKEVTGTDKTLFELAKNQQTTDTWYKNNSDFLNKSSGSGHSQPFLKTRYNLIASNSLDANKKVNSLKKFAEGSLIVKELYNQNKILERYAILYKDATNIDADENGWVWGYINVDATTAEKASNKGSACKGCHSQSGNIEYMLMNKYFQ